MSQYDPNLHPPHLKYPYPPGQPPPRPWARRHPFFFWLGVVATGLIVSAVIVTATGSNLPAPSASAVPGICTTTVLPDLRSIQNDIAHGGGSHDPNYAAAAAAAMTAGNAVMNDSSSDIGSNLDTDLTQLATDLKASTPDGSAIQHDIANVEADCK